MLTHRFALLALLLTLGCDGQEREAESTPDVTEEAPREERPAPEPPDPDEGDAEPPISEGFIARCDYTNPFSKGLECKAYTGAAWDAESAAADCDAVLLSAAGVLSLGEGCGYPQELGRCYVEGDEGYTLVSAGDDPEQCGLAQTGCEVFGGGAFEPDPLCGEGEPTTGPSEGFGETAFVQPYQTCVDPLPGEPEGQGPDGQVCTWTLISGSTEPGRRFGDYASCDDVRTQRPYYADPEPANTAPDDPRLDDAEYMAEVAWARAQVEASACVCCHSEEFTPNGPSWWSIDEGPIWIDSVRDSGLAMMAGLADSKSFGAYPPEENNGFDRTVLGLPTTDVERMQAFLIGEWARRGYAVEDGADFEAFGGPILDQLTYEPEACARGEGVDAEGRLSWSGGEARYAYILEADAANPGVPPNLDEPLGTLWFVDVATASSPFSSGISYGALEGDLRQRLPREGAPAALVAGRTYYIYVLKDIGVPITRCLFDYPAEG